VEDEDETAEMRNIRRNLIGRTREKVTLKTSACEGHSKLVLKETGRE
jgi:hypothetical protein